MGWKIFFDDIWFDVIMKVGKIIRIWRKYNEINTVIGTFRI